MGRIYRLRNDFKCYICGSHMSPNCYGHIDRHMRKHVANGLAEAFIVPWPRESRNRTGIMVVYKPLFRCAVCTSLLPSSRLSNICENCQNNRTQN